ncbi:hypothetical protein DSD19_04770 [Rhodovulum sp. BSW8]|uniref:hypothetical protein n=1 Tax=Rhodovulum sp. BSW8 TaxID=2259645 RepID=UPI000DE4A442|nr:hypothetical protein [Rhodovulum sp. BSW8]RBO54693.1 hypothetical protein DSD19_04770 [Rhodovulum sp. BSW8]
MAIWNLVACVLPGVTYPPRDALLAATDQSKLVYPSFLRDLFVMSLLTPLLVLGLRKAPWIVGAVILA